MSLPTRDAHQFSPEYHHYNWYVHRDKNVRGYLKSLWGNPKNITDKNTMEGANLNQKIVKSANILFRNMESAGPVRGEFGNYKYDRKNDFYHAHINEAGSTIVVMWEADEDKRLIRIVDIAPHENFNFQRGTRDKKAGMKKADIARKSDAKYQIYLKQQRDKKYRKGK